ncbi:hypothetical protein [Nocardia wallacei]|uniref:hypothetical protein n=1 Tax=Nocardia wallacei TaxID=480035 RepID=UPI00245557A8|nr:hypothetical protein [Nocardia wallacei]
MPAKEDVRSTDRVSVTQRPSTIKLLDEMIDASKMTKSEIFNVGIDVLHFVWAVLRKGGTIGVKFPGDTDYKPVNIFIPGMTSPSVGPD